jgi:hypothetical protein
MINPVGITIGALIYLSFMNISYAASYDVNPIANQQMDRTSSSSIFELALIETSIEHKAIEARSSSSVVRSLSISPDSFSLNSEMSKHSNKQSKYILMAFFATGFFFLTMSRGHRTKASIFF